MTFAAGDRLGSYELLSLLGAGGMGEVYRARDSKLHRDVAVKLLPEAFAADPLRLARFRREAQLLAALNHRHIAGIYGIESSGNAEALVLELVEGETLAERIARGPLPLEEATDIARQIAEALEAAHERGIVHRDLKPANVKITPEGTVKVLDFGLAKALSENGSSPDATHSPTITGVGTSAGAVMGTAAYMSPEQARGLPVDRRADIWAFGVVLYEMLTGQPAFEGRTLSDTLAAVLTREPDWSVLPRTTTPEVRRLIRLCLEKDAKKRLRDVGDAWLLSGEAATATPAARRRSGWIRTGAVAAAAAAIAVLATWMIRPRPHPALHRTFEIPVDRLNPATAPSISPDGRKILYAAAGGIRVRDLVHGGEHEVAHDDAALYPMWSPDGAQVAYLAKAKLWRVPVSGGTPAAIAPASFRETSSHAGGVWTDDNRIVFAPAATGYGLLAVAADGGELKPILERDQKAEDDIHKPSVLPGGRGILFVSDRAVGGPYAIEVFWSGGRKVILEHKGDLLDCPVYSPTGHILYFRKTATTEGIWGVPFSLAKLEVTGEPFLVARGGTWPSVSSDGLFVFASLAPNPEQLAISDAGGHLQSGLGKPEEFRRISYPRFSPDGQRVAFAGYEPNEGTNIYVRDLDTGRLTRLSVGSGTRGTPAWSPSGDRVIWRSNPSGSTEPMLVERSADAAGPERVVVRDAFNPAFSPDGRTLLFVRTIRGEADLFLVPLGEASSATETPQAFLQAPGDQSCPRFSPDGSLVAYFAEESRVFNVYVRRFPSGDERWQASFEGGMTSAWSRSGDRLFYEHDNQLFEVAVTTKPSLKLGPPRRLFSGQENGIVLDRGFDVAPNGGFFVVRAVKSEIPSKLAIVENWISDFPSKTGN